MKPKLFVGSSVEGLAIAYAIQQNLQFQAEVTVWDQGVFELSKTNIDSLITILESSDFGIFVFSPDDELIMRGDINKTARDNVIFELGLYIGKLGRDRSFFLIPEKPAIHLPTDLLGVTPGRYQTDRSDGSFQAATGPFCQMVRKSIQKLGKINIENTIASEYGEKEEMSNSFENNNSDWVTNFIHDEYKQGIEKLERLIKIEKDSNKIITYRAWISFGEFKLNKKEGELSFNDLKSEFPESTIPVIRHINALLWGDFLNEAILEIENALLIFPSDIELKLLKSNYLSKLGRPEQALEYTKNIFSSSTDPEIALNLFNLLQGKDQDAAHEVIHKAFLSNPNDISILFNYFKLSEKKQMHKIAMYLINKLIILEPENSIYWGYYGNTCLNLSLNDRSLVAYDKGKDLAKDKDGWLYGNIGNIYKNRGFYSLAIKYLRESMEIDNDSEYAHRRLSESIKLRDEEIKLLNESIEEGRQLVFNYIFEQKNSSIE